MRLLFVSHNYLPEANAPASRLGAHAAVWSELGDVDVLTSPPNFPEGRIYAGYENRYSQEQAGRLTVTRVPIYVTPNSGVVRRFLGFLSFMQSAIRHAKRLPKPDVVVATSPQFFTAIAGYRIAKRFGVPFVLEIRDLWPESIVAVGAMKRNAFIKFFERIERFLYRNADHVVVLTNAFRRHVLSHGGTEDNISVITNGVDPMFVQPTSDAERLEKLKRLTGLGDTSTFGVGYVGTIGMAHKAEILYQAARSCPHPNVRFLVVGAGAGRARLEQLVAAEPLSNFRLLDKLPREDIPALLSLLSASVVHLIDSPLFRTVIPSKIFEAMGSGLPILAGLRGESADLVTSSGAGLIFEPESVDGLLQAIDDLRQEPDRHRRLSEAGPVFVKSNFDRKQLALEYWDLLERLAHVENPTWEGEPKP